MQQLPAINNKTMTEKRSEGLNPQKKTKRKEMGLSAEHCTYLLSIPINAAALNELINSLL
jgi:hypothetical protein